MNSVAPRSGPVRAMLAVVWFALLGVLAPGTLAHGAAEPAVLAPIQAGKAKVLHGLGHLFDPSKQLTVRDLTRPAAFSAFKPFARDAFAEDRRIGAHWLKFQIAAPADRQFDYYLLFSDPGLAEYSLFMETIPGAFKERRFARAQGRADVDVRRGALGHRVTLPAGATRTFYIRLAGRPVDGTLTQWLPRAWAAFAKEGASLGWISVGMAGFAALISCFGLWFRRPAGALWSAAFGLATAAAIMARAGFLYEMPWLWRHAVVARDALPAIALVVYAGLAMQWLAGPDSRRWPRALVQILSFAVLGAALAGHFIGGAAAIAAPLLGIALIISIIAMACLSISCRRLPAFWLIGISVPLIAASIAFLVRLAGLDLGGLALEPLLWAAAAFSSMMSAIAVLLATEVFARDKALPESESMGAVMPDAPNASEIAEVAKAIADDGNMAAPPPVRQHSLRAPPRDVDPPSPASLIVELEARIGQLNRKIREREDDLTALRAATDTAGQWIDPITGVTRRAVILAEGQAILAQAQRYGRAVTVMLIEVDDYALIERQLGKVVCDKAMKLLAVSCLKNLREADRLARFDDKSFAAILPETDAIGAASLAKRLSQTLIERTLPTPKGMLQLSAVIAYTEFGEQDSTIDDMFARAARVLAEDRPGGGEQAAAE